MCASVVNVYVDYVNFHALSSWRQNFEFLGNDFVFNAGEYVKVLCFKNVKCAKYFLHLKHFLPWASIKNYVRSF